MLRLTFQSKFVGRLKSSNKFKQITNQRQVRCRTLCAATLLTGTESDASQNPDPTSERNTYVAYEISLRSAVVCCDRWRGPSDPGANRQSSFGGFFRPVAIDGARRLQERHLR